MVILIAFVGFYGCKDMNNKRNHKKKKQKNSFCDEKKDKMLKHHDL